MGWWEEPQGWREEEWRGGLQGRQGVQDGSEGPGEGMDFSLSGHPVCPRLCPKLGEPWFSGSYLQFLLGLLQAFPKQLFSPWRPRGQITLHGGKGQGVLIPLGPLRSLFGDRISHIAPCFSQLGLHPLPSPPGILSLTLSTSGFSCPLLGLPLREQKIAIGK